MRKKIILQGFLICFITAMAVFFAGIGTHYLVQEKNIKAQIVDNTAMFSQLIENDPDAVFKLGDLGDLRLTVIGEDGGVVFDSENDESSLDNHLQRQEVQYALNNNPQVVKRHSDTYDCDMYYYAQTVKNGQSLYIVRVAQQASNIWSYTGIGLVFVGIALVVAFLLCLLLAKKLSDNVEKQLKKMRNGLRNINSGDYAPITYKTHDKLNFSIITEMNEIVDNLKDKYDQIEMEKAKLYGIINNITQGIIVVDENKNIVLTNDVAKEILHCNQNCNTLDSMIEDNDLRNKIYKDLSGDNDEVFAYELFERDLVINVLKMKGEKIKDNLGIILIGDVTKEKELSKQKSIFFANASHELKTPLTSVQGLSEVLLSKTDENSANFKYIKRIYTESVRLHNIVMDMLYISKLETRNISRNHEKVDICALCREAEQAYREEIISKNLSFKVCGNTVVEGDEHNLYECINNVIGNAVHYNINDGKIDVSLYEEGIFAVIEVKDSGIGIAEEHLPHICERFYRVDKSRSKQTGGTGLGLSIVKHIVALYAGQLDIASKLGEGTCVKIKIPKSRQ